MTGEPSRIKTEPRGALRVGFAAIVLCALAFVATFTFDGGRLGVLAMSPTSTNAPTERVVIAVEGMYCDSCAAGIRAMLKRTPGVVSSDVSYKQKEAVVEYDSQKTTPEKIVEAINNLGYKATVKNKG
ncbi:MAG: cation transporter [Acidobacteriota bacterium]|nr:cation transporter [Acidobacteriota bacterium]